MVKLNDIKALNIEVSAKCNANCAFCSRKHKVRTYGDHMITAAEFKHIPDAFIQQLRWISFGGNFGDLCNNPEFPEIVRDIRRLNPDVVLEGDTNGSFQDEQWWQSLGPSFQRGAMIFAIDGLEDTHRLHRRGTDFHTIIRNVRAFTAGGGTSHCKFIVFKHNEHQIAAAEALAEDIGCTGFHAIASREYNERLLPPETIDFKIKRDVFSDYRKKLTGAQRRAVCKPIGNRSIYIAADGTVHPCCIVHLLHITEENERMRFIRPLVAKHYDRINFKTTPLADIVSGSYFTQVIEKSKQDDYCMTRCNCYKKQIGKELILRKKEFSTN